VDRASRVPRTAAGEPAGVAVAAGLFNARELVTDDEAKGSSHGSGNAEGDLHQIHQA